MSRPRWWQRFSIWAPTCMWRCRITGACSMWMWGIIIMFVLGVLILQGPGEQARRGREIPYSEFLDAVEKRLQALNADVQVEQEEYDEVVVIKAMFLNHDYQ